MCYDISYNITLETIEDYFPGLVIDPQLKVEFVSSEHSKAQDFNPHAIVLPFEGNLNLKAFEWGVVADYMDTPALINEKRKTMCNVRSEKLLESDSYWNKIKSQRCLLPVDAIYEHRHVEKWQPVPYHVTLKDRPMFALPCLYNYYDDPVTGERKGTFANLIRSANSLMKQIHNGGDNPYRMPLFLPKELELKWLDPRATDNDLKEIINFEWPAKDMEYYTAGNVRVKHKRRGHITKWGRCDRPDYPPLGRDTIQTTLF